MPPSSLISFWSCLLVGRHFFFGAPIRWESKAALNLYIKGFRGRLKALKHLRDGLLGAT
jgi:hypothetical protein